MGNTIAFLFICLSIGAVAGSPGSHRIRNRQANWRSWTTDFTESEVNTEDDWVSWTTDFTESEVVPSSTTPTSIEPTHSPRVNTTLASTINAAIDSSLSSMNDTITIFIGKLNKTLSEMEQEKEEFFENMEDGKATMIFRLFNGTHCNNTLSSPPRYEALKRSFTLRYGLLEMSLRQAIRELEDKLRDVRRRSELEREVVDVKLKACELFDLGSFCENITLPQPCLTDECLPSGQNVDSLLFNRSIQENRAIRIGLTPLGPLETVCPDGRFKCRNGNCITRAWVCDSANDCKDNSDENSSPCPRSCPGKRCRNLKCLNDNQICDGIDDCGDGTDERNCAKHTVADTFSCLNSSVRVPLNVTCDGKPDCPDSSDEGGSCDVISGCDTCSVIGGACLRSVSGPLCLNSCPSGFVFDIQSGLCIRGNSTFGERIVYRNYSFFGLMSNIKSLFNRLSNGFLLMKRDLNREIIKFLTSLKACIPHEYNA